jgi:stage III sporulation protein AB
MSLKLIGALFVILGCGGVGFSYAAAHRREEQNLRHLASALDFIECELQYRLTPLPELCRMAAQENHGCIKDVLMTLGEELENHSSPDVLSCMNVVYASVKDIPKRTRNALDVMAQSLGRFDLEGQLKGLSLVRSTCRRYLEELSANRDVRLRSYQTLGLCAGAALAILLV